MTSSRPGGGSATTLLVAGDAAQLRRIAELVLGRLRASPSSFWPSLLRSGRSFAAVRRESSGTRWGRSAPSSSAGSSSAWWPHRFRATRLRAGHVPARTQPWPAGAGRAGRRAGAGDRRPDFRLREGLPRSGGRARRPDRDNVFSSFCRPSARHRRSAREVYPFSEEVRSSTTYARTFRTITLVWGAYFLLRSGRRLAALLTLSVDGYLLRCPQRRSRSRHVARLVGRYTARMFRRSDEWGGEIVPPPRRVRSRRPPALTLTGDDPTAPDRGDQPLHRLRLVPVRRPGDPREPAREARAARDCDRSARSSRSGSACRGTVPLERAGDVFRWSAGSTQRDLTAAMELVRGTLPGLSGRDRRLRPQGPLRPRAPCATEGLPQRLRGRRPPPDPASSPPGCSSGFHGRRSRTRRGWRTRRCDATSSRRSPRWRRSGLKKPSAKLRSVGTAPEEPLMNH